MVDIAVAHGTDLGHARHLLHQIAAGVSLHPRFVDDVLEPPEVLGVHRVDGDGITVRLRVKTRAGRQFDLQRALLERITAVFAASGVQLATPQLTVRIPSATRAPRRPDGVAGDGQVGGRPDGAPREA
jgi:small conductance mechanosensitive channel